MSHDAFLSQNPSEIDRRLWSWLRHLRARNARPRTLEAYSGSLKKLHEFLTKECMPIDVSEISQEHLEAFIADQLDRWAPATANARFRAISSFFSYLVEDEFIEISPMRKMKAPKIPEKQVPVLTEDQIQSLLNACRGRGFEDRRDDAFIRIFIDTGGRRAEVGGLRYSESDPLSNDVDVEQGVIRLQGKGGRERVAAIGDRTIRSLDRYLTARERHAYVNLPWLWLGQKGRLAESGMRQALQRRANQAGLGRIHPHLFRHAFAHYWLAAGGNETDLMRLAGWRSRSMLDRYGASAGTDRAIAAHRTFSPGNRFR